MERAVAEHTVAEEWRPVVGYEGLYSVSNLGRVRRDRAGGRYRAGAIRAIVLNIHGYPQAVLYRENVNKTFTVHGLVAAAFIGPRPDGYEVNHLNGVKTDNRAENLEYATHAQNMRHTIETLGKRYDGDHCPNAKLTASQVIAIRAAYREGNRTQRDLAREFDVTQGNISRIVTRRVHKHAEADLASAGRVV